MARQTNGLGPLDARLGKEGRDRQVREPWEGEERRRDEGMQEVWASPGLSDPGNGSLSLCIVAAVPHHSRRVASFLLLRRNVSRASRVEETEQSRAGQPGKQGKALSSQLMHPDCNNLCGMDDDQRKPNQPRLKLDTTITGDPDAAPNPIRMRPATGNLSVLLRRSSEDPTGFHHTIRTSLTITPPRPINEETIEEDPLAVEDAIPAPTTTDASAGAGLGEGPSTVTIATSGPGTAITIPVSVPETLPGISTTAPALPLGALNPLPTCDLSSPHSPPIGSPSPLIRLLQGHGGNRFVGDSDPSTRDNSPSFTPAQQALQPPDDVRVTPSTLSLAPVEGASGTQETQQQERPRDSPWTLPFSPTPVQAPAVPFPEPTSSPWLDKAKPEEDPSDNSLTSPASRESRVSLAHRPRRSTAASSFLSQFTVPDPSPPSPDEEGQLIADDWIVGRDVGNGGFSIVKQG
ncbi:hypothetical protein KEM55_006252, partial [Ascosphaera atra]